MSQCGTPPPDHKSCDKIYPLGILLVNSDQNSSQEMKAADLKILVLANLRCRKKYDDFKKISPFL
jgi:hypothetical protein